MKLFLGIDIGATWTRLALHDGSSIVRKVVFRTPRETDSYCISNAIISAIRSELRDYVDSIAAVGIGSIGPLDLRRGIIVGAPNIPAKRVELARPLLEELRKPVYLANDCVAAVWGEKSFGAGKGCENIVYVTISTGIGGGMIINGALLLGKMGNGHEIGHTVVDVDRRLRCNCGGYGHWEAYCSGANIPRFASYLIERVPSIHEYRSSKLYALWEEGKLRSEDVYRLAREGDPLARLVVSEITKLNIAGFENVVNLYDPEVITVGGSVALNNVDLVIEPVKQAIESGRGIVTEPPRLVPTPLGGDAVLLGAVAIAMDPPPQLVKLLEYLSSL
ncbi:MAG: ROK family protein [Crenarchaeota archaeon]|nr:ROK family protein [Thermoproteota archaeon]